MRTIFLEVEENNLPARRLYEWAGFGVVGRRERYYKQPRRGTFECASDAARLVLNCAGWQNSPPCAARLGPVASRFASLKANDHGRTEILVRDEKYRHRGALRRHRHAHDRTAPRHRARAGGSGDHPDVEELYRRCVAVDDKISISTVYRTVKLFEDAGIIERHDFREGRARYEQMRDSHHDHLINLRDGKVIEFTSEEIEKLQAEIARKLGYKLVDHRLELYCVPLDDDKT